MPAFPTPRYNWSVDCRGPSLGFLSQASGKLAFLGSRLGSRPGQHAGRMLWKMHRRAEGAGAGHLGGGGPGGGTQGLSFRFHSTLPQLACWVSWAGM